LRFDADAGGAVEETDLGVAAPAALGPFGCAVISGDDELAVTPMKQGRIAPFTATIKSSNAPWPSVAEGSPSRVYWISKGRLVRRKVSSDGAVGQLEVLAEDAADFTAVAAAHAEGGGAGDAVAYIARTASKEVPRNARVWIEGKGSRALSADGAGASAVAAAPLAAGKIMLWSMDGRLALSPVHYRVLELPAARLTEDQVVHVAGPSEGEVSFATLHAGALPVGLAAISRDTSTFGLLTLAMKPGESEAAASWLMYANGVTPAPVAAATLCSKPAVAWVQPEDATPKGRKAIVVGLVDAEGHVQDPIAVAAADKVRHLAFAAIEPVAQAPSKGAKGKQVGAMIVFAADDRLHTRAIACR
jgi:hypothetical protein